MKVKTGVAFACISTLTFIACPGGALWAQTAKPPAAAPEPAPQAATIGSQDTTNDLSVATGKSVVLDLAHPVTRIVVGAGQFAEATAVSPTQVLVNGIKAGDTSLIIWDSAGGRQFFNVSVRPSAFETKDKLDAVRRELRAELPGQAIKISEEGGNIFLRGTVQDLTSSDRAVLIAGTAGKVINLLNVTVPQAAPQILLKVRFASIDRNKSRQLGLNIFSTGAGNTIGSVSTGQYAPPGLSGFANSGSTNVTLSSQLQLFAFYPGINLGATLQALETKGVAQVLAEPNLLAENGKQASFLAGGEYPYPMVQSSGGGGGAAPITIQFKQYGVRLNFRPTITPQGTIRLQVAPEVSALDFADAVTIAGFTVPAITVRRVSTEIELKDGQSFAIGGLLDNRETETFLKIPFLGDIPILGKLFQSMTRNRTNTELIVIVTPEIVEPVPAGQNIASPNYPRTFLPPNSSTPMHTPDTKTTGNTLPPPPAAIPVDQLRESLKPEPALQDTGGGGGMGSYSGGGGTGVSTGP